MSITVRPATLADADLLISGNAAMALETEGLTLDPDVLRGGVLAGLQGRARYLIAERDGVVAGQLMLTEEWSDWRNATVWWIQSVYVWPEHRRRRVYAALYDATQVQARANGVAGIRLYVDKTNTSAQDVYTALGMDGSHYQMFEAMFT